MTLKLTLSDNRLRREIEQACGVDLDLCHECGKCSGGCPTAHHFDFTPRKIIQMVRLGAEEKLMNIDALSICISCHLCAERCPAGINIPEIIDCLRERALRGGVPPKRPRVELFNKLFIDEISRRGRVSEIFLIARYKLKTGDMWSDFRTGLRLFFKGKLKLFTPGVKGTGQVREILKNTNPGPAGRGGQ